VRSCSIIVARYGKDREGASERRLNVIKLKASLRPHKPVAVARQGFHYYKEVTSSTIFHINCYARFFP